MAPCSHCLSLAAEILLSVLGTGTCCRLVSPTHTHRLWANETEHGDGNPGAILVDWLGPAGQCLIGQLVLVVSPLARPRKAVIGRLIKTSAPLSRLPCAGLPRSWPIPAPRRSQAASPVRHPLPPASRPKKYMGLGSPRPFLFLFFFFSILCALLDFFPLLFKKPA
ncbi:hypothetical protein J3F84DRAFT_142988 [Trichoderma pleuroticola]